MNMKAFEQYKLPAFLIEALEKQKLNSPTDIQERLIPAVINGKDVIGQSQTGSGKTLAFLLPIIARIEPDVKEVQAVITAPTRELVEQINKVLKGLLADQPEDRVITSQRVVGGSDRKRDIEKLQNTPHIIVASPGRLRDMVKTQSVDIHRVKMLVIDEADQMLDMGFIEEIDPVAALMPDTLQMMVFSATIPESLQPFLKKYMTNPKHVHIDPKSAAPREINHYFLPLKHKDRTEETVRIASSIQPYLAIVFANKKEEADEVHAAFLEKGLNADLLHGGLSPRERKQVMRRVHSLEVQYLIATDLAARGVDIPGITHIINHTLPTDLEYYVHRIGRSGRAGLSGEAYTLIEKDELASLQKLEKKGIKCELVELRKGEFVKTVDRKSFRAASQKQEQKAVPKKPKPKNVKPGYKKKAQQELSHQQSREKRLNKRKDKRS